MSGKVKRAPIWMRKMRFEWLYRLWLEPDRMWRRYITGTFLFFYYLLKLRITSLQGKNISTASMNTFKN